MTAFPAADISRATDADIDDAIDAAARACASWTATPPGERGRALRGLVRAIETTGPAWAERLEEAGHRPRDITAHLDAAVTRLLGFAGWCDKLGLVLGATPAVAGPYACATTPRPVGVVGVIAPAEPVWLGVVTLIAVPLCAGNPVVVVSDAPLAALAAAVKDSGLPAGVVSVVMGTGTGSEQIERLVGAAAVRVVTGLRPSPARARTLRERAAEGDTRLHLERINDRDWRDDAIRLAPETIAPFVQGRTLWHPAEV